VARVLIIPCGERELALARALREAGHAVRGTTRDPAGTEAIRAAGAEPYIGDPDRIGTLMDALHGVTVLCWLMGDSDFPESRLRMLWEKLVDTPVRGVVHEGKGDAVSRAGAETWRIPLAVIEGDPHGDDWLERATSAVERLLS
jgi:hypothetical protein